MRRPVVSAALALSVAMPAAAQRDDNARFGVPAETPENRADLSLARFVICAERASQSTAAKVLETPLGSAEEAKAVGKLAALNRACAPSYPLPFATTAVRNALATITYRRTYRDNVPPATPAGTKPPATFAVAPAGVRGDERQEVVWYLGGVANCVVFVDPPAAHRLVTGPIDVPEEDRRFAALSAAIGRCSPANGPALNTRVLRGYLANALLRQVGDGTKVKS